MPASNVPAAHFIRYDELMVKQFLYQAHCSLRLDRAPYEGVARLKFLQGDCRSGLSHLPAGAHELHKD